MNMETVSGNDAPRPTARVDYDEVANRYNELPVGGVIRMERHTNIVHFKNALKRRGLEEHRDYKAYQRGKHCFLKRQSDKSMSE